MQLTFIITIDPVKQLSLLDILLHSLNLQTANNFDVVFFNQTLLDESEIFAELRIRPEFRYRFFSVERGHFLGNFPLWDLYGFHRQLLESDLLGDYFMSMHMEEFFDIDYVENVTRVLETAGFDILFGNLCRSRLDGAKIADILTAGSAREFEDFLKRHGMKKARHWAFQPLPAPPVARLSVLRSHLYKFVDFGFRTRLVPSPKGYSKLPTHYEDLYFMKKAFAHEYNWFLPGRSMYFEDIHLCDISGVCELGQELAKLTDFLNYFNLSKVYHVEHQKFYYQLQDAGFTEGLLALDTDDLLLQTLQQAVRMYRSGKVNLEEALRFTRRNGAGTGTQDLNYKYHMQVIKQAQSSIPDPARSRSGTSDTS